MASGNTVFQYSGLYVRISEAKKLPSRDMSGLRDPFCLLKVDNETVARTATTFKTLEPFWGEEYNLHIPNEFQNVSVYVYDYDMMGSKEPLGKVMLDRPTIVKSPRGLDKWFPLTPISKDDSVQGEILVEMTMEQYTEECFKLYLTVVEARDLAIRGERKSSDPKATIYYNKEEFSTQVIQKTRFPRWRKSFEVNIPRNFTDDESKSLVIVVYDFDRLAHNKFMGQIEIDLTELQLGQRYQTWYRLQHHEPKQKEKKSKELGSLRLKVQAHEERILEASFYETFVAMMLKAVEDPRPEGSPILMMLEEVMTMDRNSLAHTLVRFYLAHGSVLPFLDTLTMKEIHQTSTPRTLFRSNSLASKSFDQFMKIVALPFLHEILSGSIDAVYNDHKVCELDIEQLKQASKMRSDSIAQKTLDTSVGTLTSYIDSIMTSIFSSVDNCPPLLRQALRQLWVRVEGKYKDSEYVDVPYLAITGFLFLRFFVPAVLSPKLFSVRDEHPDQRTERTLKLIAKILQMIGNLSTEIDAKEKYMVAIAPILPHGVKRIKEYILDMVQIDQRNVAAEKGVKDGGYIHHLILCKGWLWKRSTGSSVANALQYRKRYFELSNVALTYAQNERNMGEVKSYPVQWIKVVEKIDENAFHRKHMFQIVVIPSGPIYSPDTPSQINLYLQAADVNEQNRWVSVIRKACLSNREMCPVYHPGAYKNKKWTCCRVTISMEPGCSQCHRGITIGDWRDPLDPDLDAQVIFSQFSQGKSALQKKYLPACDDLSSSTRDGSVSPTSMTSSGATSLQQEDHDVGGGASSTSADHSSMETNCKQLLDVVEALAYHHSEIQPIT